MSLFLLSIRCTELCSVCNTCCSEGCLLIIAKKAPVPEKPGYFADCGMRKVVKGNLRKINADLFCGMKGGTEG